MVKNLPAVQEARVPSLGWEDHLEKRMATHCSILAWRIPCTEEPGRLQSMGLQRVRLSTSTIAPGFTTKRSSTSDQKARMREDEAVRVRACL